MRENLKKMLSYYRPYRRVFAADMFFAILASVIALAIPLIARFITSNIIYLEKSEVLKQTLLLGVLMVGLVLVYCYCNFYISNYGHVMGAKIEYDMRSEIFGHYQKLSFAFYDNQKVGALMSRITTDLFDITELMHHGPENVVISAIKICGAFVIMLCISPILTFFAFALVPVMFVYAYFFNGKMKRAFRRNREKISEINSRIEDNLSGIRVVKSFANEQMEEEKFGEGNRGFLDAKKNSYFYMGGYHAGLSSFSLLITVVVLVAGAVFISMGMIDVTDLITFLLYINVLTEPVKTLIDFTEQFQNGYTGFERFLEIMAIKPDIEDDANAADLPAAAGAVDFENVSFRYEENSEKVLSHVNLHVDAGEYVALVGSSGAGKSTLCSLIPRFYDVTDGRITIDGMDIREVSQHDLRDRLGYVPQKGVLFSGDIASNILYGNPDGSEEEMTEAANIAQAEEFIEQKQKRYHSPIAQGGSNVSGGQKQRLSIARAVAKHPDIYIFDDSFSALDYKTDVKLRNALKTKTKDSTVMIVAQRISTILHAEQIIVLDDGKIVGKGTHKELLKNCEEYYQIASSQLSEKELEDDMKEVG